MSLYTKQLPETLSFLEEDIAINKYKLDSLVYSNMTGLSYIYNNNFICENIINNIEEIKFGFVHNSGISWDNNTGKIGFLNCYKHLNKADTYGGLLPNIRKIAIVPNIKHEDWRIDYWSCYILDEEFTESIINILNK